MSGSISQLRRILGKRTYLAATFEDRARMREHREELFALAIDVTATWINAGPDVSANPLEHGNRCLSATLDCVADVRCASSLVQFTEPRNSPGKYVELGMAIALNMPIVVVGPLKTVFHFHTCVAARYETWSDLVRDLGE